MINMTMMMTRASPASPAREQERNKRRKQRNKAQNWRNNSKYIYDDAFAPSLLFCAAQKRSVIAHTERSAAHTHNSSNSMRNIKKLLFSSFYHFFLCSFFFGFCAKREAAAIVLLLLQLPIIPHMEVTAAPQHNYYLFSFTFSLWATQWLAGTPLQLSPHLTPDFDPICVSCCTTARCVSALCRAFKMPANLDKYHHHLATITINLRPQTFEHDYYFAVSLSLNCDNFLFGFPEAQIRVLSRQRASERERETSTNYER